MKKLKRCRKKITSVFLVYVLCITCLLTCKTDVQAKTKIRLSNSKITLYKGQSKTLKVKGTKKKVKWSSSKKSVATVSKKGKVKAKKKGTATITAKIGKKKYKCKVTVKYGGTLTGEIENAKGNPDYESQVILIPKNGKAKKLVLHDAFDWATATINDYVKYNIYGKTVYEKGRYTITNIEPGNYVCLIISNYYDDNHDPENPDYFADYFNKYLSKKNINFLKEYVIGYQYNIYPNVKIKNKKKTTLNEYFWYYDAI